MYCTRRHSVSELGSEPLAEVERRHVLRVLEQVGGNKVQAAKILGINRATVYRIANEPDPGEDVAAIASS